VCRSEIVLTKEGIPFFGENFLTFF
jgi:hypothetical protein